MAPRQTYSKIADIPPSVLEQLNTGAIETGTLAEGLAIDFRQLMEHVAPELPADAWQIVANVAEQGITRRMSTVGAVLLAEFGIDDLARFADHPADTVRGWACYMIGLAPKLKLKARLELLRPLADDSHFGVREWAWLALRPELAKNVSHAVASLTPWTAETSANLRRFACEATRPRGVWASHIEQLKQNPALGLAILEPLRADDSEYVQDSVANWLNDAGKSNATWVRELVARWRHESECEATERICKRATRNLTQK
jgi:3-methyladenine DNA glycosylase AlkC